MFSERHHYLGRGAQLCPVVGRLEVVGTGCAGMGQSQPLLTEAAPAAPPLPVPGHGHPIHCGIAVSIESISGISSLSNNQ